MLPVIEPAISKAGHEKTNELGLHHTAPDENGGGQEVLRIGLLHQPDAWKFEAEVSDVEEAAQHGVFRWA